MEQDTYTASQFAKLLNVTTKTVYTWYKQGIVQGYCLSRKNGIHIYTIPDPEIIAFRKRCYLKRDRYLHNTSLKGV